MPAIRAGTFLPPEALSDVATLAATAAYAVALARAGESRKGLALALRARQQARGLEIEKGELEALNAAAIVHAMRGDHIAAVAAGIDAYELARRLERGRIHLAMSEPDAACKAYEAALEIAQDLRPSMKIEDACAGLARVEQARGNPIGARRWATRAAVEADEFDRVRGHARRQLEACFTVVPA